MYKVVIKNSLKNKRPCTVKSVVDLVGSYVN